MTDYLSDFDLSAICLSLIIFFLYHVHLYILNPSCFNGRVPFGVNLKNAGMWIRKHKEMSESANVLLAIQTLRNTMMVGVFVGATTINFAFSFANEYPNVHTAPLRVRSLVISVLMFASFLCWANVVRLCSVMGYMIGTIQYSEKLRKEAIEQERAEFEAMEAQSIAVKEEGIQMETFTASAVPPTKRKQSIFRSKLKNIDGTDVHHDEDDKIEKLRKVSAKIPDIFQEAKRMIKMSTIYFSFGFRLMFVSIPFAFYSAGPIALVIASGVILLFLWSYDYFRHNSPKDDGI